MLDRFHFIHVRWLVRWTPVFVLLLAAFWRLDGITAQSFWNDEGNTLSLIQRDIPDLLDNVRPDIHPPGYYILLKGWTALAGRNEMGLRSYSAFMGILAVVFTYALGARLYSRAAGIIAALLVAMNAFAVYYSQEARMYAQLAALSIISLYLLAILVQTPPRSMRFVRLAAALAVVNTLGLYTQYTYPFTMMVQGVFFLWWFLKYPPQGESRSKSLLAYVLANLITLILFLPWLPTAYDQITAWPTFDSGVALSEKITTVFTYITFGNTASGLGWMDFLWIGVILFTTVLPDWYRDPPSNNWRVGLPLVWMLVICGALFYSGAYRDANLKFLLPAQIAMALLLGRGIYLLWDVGSGSAATPVEMIPRFIAGIAFVTIISSMYGWLDEVRFNPVFQRDDYRGMAQLIDATATAEDAVILNAPGQIDVFSYYYNGQADVYALPRGYGGDDDATRAETMDIVAQHRRIFVIFWGEGERDPHDIVRSTLNENAYEIFSRWYGDVLLVQYSVLQAPPEKPEHELAVHFGEHITLDGYALTGSINAGEVIGMTLFWHTDAELQTRYKISVQLLNADGSLVSQHDSEPANNRAMTTTWQPGETVIDNHGIPIPPDVSAGEYTIMVGVYELDAPANRLPVDADSGADSSSRDSLILEKVNIP